MNDYTDPTIGSVENSGIEPAAQGRMGIWGPAVLVVAVWETLVVINSGGIVTVTLYAFGYTETNLQ